MGYDPERHHRRSVRLPGYDYSRAGAHFVTICTHERAPAFGRVVAGVVQLSDAGRIADQAWQTLPDHHPSAWADVFVVMPDHVHAIVVIGESGPPRPTEDLTGATPASPPPSPFPPFPRSLWSNTSERPPREFAVPGPHRRMVPGGPAAGSLAAVVGSYKASVTRMARASGFVGGKKPLWQRDYHAWVIRDEAALRRIQRYIANNPARWSERHGW